MRHAVLGWSLLLLAGFGLLAQPAGAQCEFPQGPYGPAPNNDILTSGSMMDEARLIDPDFFTSVLDAIIPTLLPSWSGTFSNLDNDGNGINDNDHMDMLAAVRDGNATAVAGLPGATVTAIRSAFTANRAKLYTTELVINNVNLYALGGLVNINRTVTTGSDLSIPVVGATYIPSLWTVTEQLRNPGDEGIVASADVMLEIALADYLTSMMTLADSSTVTYIQSTMQTFLQLFINTALEDLLAGAGDVNSFNIAPNGTITVDLTVSGIDATVTIPGTEVTNAITNFKNKFNCTNFTCSSALTTTGNLNGSGSNNLTAYNNATSPKRQNWITAKGLASAPLQFSPKPAAFTGPVSSNVSLDGAYGVVGGTGASRNYDWERLYLNEPGQQSYEIYNPELAGFTDTQYFTLFNAQASDSGWYSTITCDGSWKRVAPPFFVTIGNVPPSVSSVSVTGPLTVEVEFNVNMNTTQATNNGNYTVSGSGAGTLTSNPASVQQLSAKRYQLTWNSPNEMKIGGNITVTVAGSVQSALGDPMTSPFSGTAIGAGQGTAPQVTDITTQNAGPTAAASIAHTVTFSESVTGVNATNFSVATVSGTAAGTVNGTVTGAGTTWTVTIDNITGAGQIRLALSTATGIVDLAGNALSNTLTNDASAVSQVDRVAPSVPSTPDMTTGTDTGLSTSDNITKNQTPTFTGTGEAGSTIDLISKPSNTVVGTGTVTGGGTWSITASTLAESVTGISARARDTLGNTSAESSTLAVVIDITAPAIPSVPDLTAGTDTGTSSTDNITIGSPQGTVTFTGTRDANTRVQLIRNSDSAVLDTDSAAGTSYTVTGTGTAEGSRGFRAKAIDVAGNESTLSGSLTVAMDYTAPTISARSPASGATVGTLSSVSVTFLESVAGVVAGNLDVAGSAASGVSGSGTGPYAFNGFANPADGPVNVTMASGSITDVAGNAFAGNGWSYTKNTSNPSVNLTSVSVSDGGIYNSFIDVTATFSEPVFGTGAAADAFTVSDIVVTGGTASALTGFGANGDTFTFRVTPTAGAQASLPVSVTIPVNVCTGVAPAANRGNFASNSYDYTYDNVKPIVTSISALDFGPTNADTIIFTVVFNGPVVGFDDSSDIFPILSGTAFSGANIIQDTATQYTVELLNVTGDGTILLQVNANVATDAAGNGNTSQIGFFPVTIDNTAPVVTVNSLATQDSTPTLTGTVDDPTATVQVTIAGQTKTASIAGSNWTVNGALFANITDGVYDVLVAGTDDAGNVGNDATTNEVTIDTEAPVITLLGDTFVVLDCGDGYTDPGIDTAIDNVDGDVSGSVSPSITIPPFSPPGSYFIEYSVSDSVGNPTTVTRQVVILSNCTLAVDLLVPNFIEKEGGESVTFEVSATGAQPGPPTFQWYKASSAKADQPIGDDSASLTLTNLQASDDANYYVSVSDAVTTVTSAQITLQVNIELPLAGGLGLMAVAGALAMAGSTVLRRRK